jgi:ATP-dependent Clp protease ATP-binding subunit ClpC
MDYPYTLTNEDKKRVSLNPNQKSKFIDHLEQKLKKQIIGQSEAVDNILHSIDRVVAGIKSREKPILTMLFLGPTGTGKTETVKVLAETLFGKRDAFIRINCQEFSSEHVVARLFGSPPGYVGNEIEPMLSQSNLDRFCKKAIDDKVGLFAPGSKWGNRLYNVVTDEYLSIVLFDEIEKAHPKVWTALLGIMDDGNLTLGKNDLVSFKNCIIIMTTNVGSKEIDQTLKGNTIGFSVQPEEEKSVNVTKKAQEEVKEHFPPEFCNRFDEIVAFKTLTPTDIEYIIGVQLKYFFKDLVDAKVPLYIRYSDKFIKYIVKEGFNKQYGARHLNRTIKNKLIIPISRLITTQQIIPGDVLTIDYVDPVIDFIREPRTEEQLKKLHANNCCPIGEIPKYKKSTNKKKQVKK